MTRPYPCITSVERYSVEKFWLDERCQSSAQQSQMKEEEPAASVAGEVGLAATAAAAHSHEGGKAHRHTHAHPHAHGAHKGHEGGGGLGLNRDAEHKGHLRDVDIIGE